jgi:hypothetical protein
MPLCYHVCNNYIRTDINSGSVLIAVKFFSHSALSTPYFPLFSFFPLFTSPFPLVHLFSLFYVIMIISFLLGLSMFMSDSSCSGILVQPDYLTISHLTHLPPNLPPHPVYPEKTDSTPSNTQAQSCSDAPPYLVAQNLKRNDSKFTSKMTFMTRKYIVYGTSMHSFERIFIII